MEKLNINSESVKGNEAMREGAKFFFHKLFSKEEDVIQRLEV